MGKVISEPLTPEVIRKANERGAAIVNAPTAIMEADISTVEGAPHLRFVFRDGTRLSVPLSRMKELANASAEALKSLEVTRARDSISFPDIDVDIYVPGLLSTLYATEILSVQGRIGGKKSSPAKTAAVRENGRKGGRPRKKAA